MNGRAAFLTRYYLGNQIEKNEIGWVRSMYRGEMHAGFWCGDLSE